MGGMHAASFTDHYARSLSIIAVSGAETFYYLCRKPEKPAKTTRSNARLGLHISLLAEKLLQYLRAPAGQHSRGYFNAMVEPGMVQHLQHRPGCAGFRIRRSVDKACQAGVSHGPGTHGAGLDRNEHYAAYQAVIFQPCSRLPQSDNLGMGRRIVIAQVAVLTKPHHLFALHNHCTHRDLARGPGSLRLLQGKLHPGGVIT
jgi:hypothetical protein